MQLCVYLQICYKSPVNYEVIIKYDFNICSPLKDLPYRVNFSKFSSYDYYLKTL